MAWRYVAVIWLAIFGVAVSSCSDSDGDGTGAAKEKVYVIKFPHVTAPGTPKGQGADLLKALVEERMAGRVVVEVYPAGQLMSDDDSLEALAFGEIQMIAVSLSKFDRLTNKFEVFDLPFLFDDIAAVERFQAGPEGQALLAALEDKGFKGLGFWHNGMKQFGAPVPLKRPEDAAKLRFRIQESDILQAQFLAVGASPQKMAFGEVYQALQNHTIDAQENTWSNIYSQKFFEVQDALTESNHGYLGYYLAVNKRFWDGLPGDLRGELEAIVAEVNRSVNENAARINIDARRTLVEDEGKTITVLTPEDIAAWKAAMQPVWEEFEGDIGAATIAAAQQANRAED